MEKAIQISYDKHFDLKCALAAEAGFQGISVNFNDMEEFSEAAWSKAPDKINEILSRNGLKCVQTHLPYYDLRISAEILDDKMENAIKNSIITSGKIGAPWCVYHPRSAVNDGFMSKKAHEINKRVISGYIDSATKAGTGIALENLPIFNIVPRMPFYPSDYGDLCDLHDAFNSSSVSVCWDFGHANMMHYDQAQAIKYLGQRISCTHIHNNFKHNDDHLTPDQGNIDWEKTMGAFKEINYSGPLTLETHCHYHDEELLRSFAKHNYACLVYLESLIKL